MSEVNVRNPALVLASEASSEVTQKFATRTLLLHLLLYNRLYENLARSSGSHTYSFLKLSRDETLNTLEAREFCREKVVTYF